MRYLVAFVAAVGLAAGVNLAAQSPSGAAPARAAAPPAKLAAPGTWKVPRTADGKPDLQGVWSNNSVTPMTRPTQWKDKDRLTDAEVEELKGIVARYVNESGDAIFTSLVQMALNAKTTGQFNQRSYDPTTGNYNQFWMSERDWDNRTSLIIDPPNGQMPALTPAAQARRARGGARQVVVEGSESGPRGPADGPEDRPLSERCISYGAPRTSTGYNSYVQITQSPETVSILQEMIHDARIVPMDGRPHLPSTVRQLHGDPRGHWEGDTLVVETTNFINGFQGSTPNVKVIEKYTRPEQNYLNWEITVIDPDTWVQPWTFMIRLKHVDEQLYEYACHEGNRSMVGILAGARADEAKAAAAAAAKPASTSTTPAR
ncbi:MAG TPA: hypothetical protein VJP86_10735 [Vicinamibacterales bacterium]|nr:hypothetical protein [Vicinamibacterales bacterium]